MSEESHQCGEIFEIIVPVIMGLSDPGGSPRRKEDQPRHGRLLHPSERIEILRDSAESAASAQGFFPGVEELLSRVEFMKTAGASVERVASAQQAFEALAEVVASAQGVFYQQRVRELTMLQASKEGVKVEHLAEAAGQDRSTINRWRKRTREFFETKTRLTTYPSGRDRTIACRHPKCETAFTIHHGILTSPGEVAGQAERVAMYRHWRNDHLWKPSAKTQAASLPTDDSEDETNPREPDEVSELQRELDEFSERQREREEDAARLKVQSLRNRYPDESFSKRSLEVLEELAKNADEQYSSLKEGIDRSGSESLWLGRIVQSTQEQTHYQMRLELAVLWAAELGVRMATIARAADKTAPTVKRWSLKTKELVEQLQTEARLATDSSGETSLVCERCRTGFTTTESDRHSETAYAMMYIHLWNHHVDQSGTTLPQPQELGLDSSDGAGER